MENDGQEGMRLLVTGGAVYAIEAGKIQRELGWSAAHNFPEALQLTVGWYLGNEEWVKSVMS